MKNLFAHLFVFLFLSILNPNYARTVFTEKRNFFGADNKVIQYTGRIDFSNPKSPRFYSPGVYIKAGFEGSFCSFIVNDEVLWGKSHNYLQIIVDDTILFSSLIKE